MTTPNPTLAETLKAFAAYLQSQDRSPVTIRGYLGDLALFARWFSESDHQAFSIQEITTADIQAYRQFLLGAGCRTQTINRRLAALAACGHWAAQAGLVGSNPAQNVRSIAANRSLAPRWLDKNQRLAFIRAVEKDVQTAQKRYPRLWVLRRRDATMVLVLLHTGLRVGELCALRLDDLHLSERKGHLVVRAGKGLKQRSVPLNAPARDALQNWLQVRPEVTMDALFTGQRSEPVDSRSVQRAVIRFARAAGLKDVTPHTLRHSFAKGLIDEGVSMEKVATLLGHSSLNTTRIYTVPGEEELEQAVDKLS